jgi:hypothetical protein
VTIVNISNTIQLGSVLQVCGNWCSCLHSGAALTGQIANTQEQNPYADGSGPILGLSMF